MYTRISEKRLAPMSTKVYEDRIFSHGHGIKFSTVIWKPWNKKESRLKTSKREAFVYFCVPFKSKKSSYIIEKLPTWNLHLYMNEGHNRYTLIVLCKVVDGLVPTFASINASTQQQKKHQITSKTNLKCLH